MHFPSDALDGGRGREKGQVKYFPLWERKRGEVERAGSELRNGLNHPWGVAETPSPTGWQLFLHLSTELRASSLLCVWGCTCVRQAWFHTPDTLKFILCNNQYHPPSPPSSHSSTDPFSTAAITNNSCPPIQFPTLNPVQQVTEQHSASEWRGGDTVSGRGVGKN